MQATSAFETLLRRFPTMRLAGSPDELGWASSFLSHGLVRLPVQLT